MNICFHQILHVNKAKVANDKINFANEFFANERRKRMRINDFPLSSICHQTAPIPLIICSQALHNLP